MPTNEHGEGTSKELLSAHEELRRSKPYKDQVIRVNRVIRDFLKAVSAITFYSKRSPYLGAESFLFSQFDDLFQSILWIPKFVDEGTFNIPRRDLRYVLEKTCVYSYLDCAFYGKSRDEKLEIFAANESEMKVDLVSDLKLEGFSTEQKTDFCADVKRVYSELCRYVHPSFHQIRQRDREIAPHGCLGLETVEDLRKFVDEVVVVLDLVLALYFHALTMSLTGDIFTAYLDDYAEWKFFRQRWCKVISESFDYKLERQMRRRALTEES